MRGSQRTAAVGEEAEERGADEEAEEEARVGGLRLPGVPAHQVPLRDDGLPSARVQAAKLMLMPAVHSWLHSALHVTLI